MLFGKDKWRRKKSNLGVSLFFLHANREHKFPSLLHQRRLTKSMAFREMLCPFQHPSVFFSGTRVENHCMLPTLGVPLSPNTSFCLVSLLFIQPWGLRAWDLQRKLHASPDGLDSYPEDSCKIPFFQNSTAFHRCCVLKQCLFLSCLAYSSKQSHSAQFNARRKVSFYYFCFDVK